MERAEKILFGICKTVSTIPSLFTLERIVHATMIAFALGGISNATAFMTAAGHDWFPSIMIAAALGGALVATSMALMNVDFNHELWRFIVMALIVVGIAWLSGTIQYQVYLSHGMEVGQAALIGYGLPAICEGLLAAYIGLYAQTQRKARIRNATDGAAEQVAGAVAEAMGSIDVTKVRKYVDRRVDTLTRAIVDQTIDDLMPTVTPSQDAQTERTDAIASATETNADVTAERSTGVTNAPNVTPDLAVANAQRTVKTNERRTQLLKILQSEFNGADAESLNKTDLAGRLDVTRQTVSRDINKLITDGRISMNGVVKVVN